MNNSRALAFEGVGYGSRSMAFDGVWAPETVQPQPQPQPQPAPIVRQPAPVSAGGAPLVWGAGGGGIPLRAGGWKEEVADDLAAEIERRWKREQEIVAALVRAAGRPRASLKGAAEKLWREHLARRSDFGLVLSDEVLFVAARAAAEGRLHPTVRSWAIRSLVEAGGPESAAERLRVLYRAVADSMLHVPNPVGAQWIAAAEVTTASRLREAELAGGSCVDYAVKLAAALLSVGIPAALVGQSSRADGVFDHVAVAAWDGAEWVRLDASDRAMKPGESRPSTKEVWIHLPSIEVAHRGPPPKAVRMPSVAEDAAFPMVGVGRLGWPRGKPLPPEPLAEEPNVARSDVACLLFALAVVGAVVLCIAALGRGR